VGSGREGRVLLGELRRFVRAVRREKRAGAEGLVPAGIAVLARDRRPAWMRIPGRAIHPRVPTARAEAATVELAPDAAPLLERALASDLGLMGHSRATFEVWLGSPSPGCLSVHVGIARVGTLEGPAVERLRPLIAQAERSKLKLLAIATVTRAEGESPPYLMTVMVPRVA
jgi:hypothetical protein